MYAIRSYYGIEIIQIRCRIIKPFVQKTHSGTRFQLQFEKVSFDQFKIQVRINCQQLPEHFRVAKVKSNQTDSDSREIVILMSYNFV